MSRRNEAFIFDLDGTLLTINASVSFYLYSLKRGLFPISSVLPTLLDGGRFLLSSDVRRLNERVFARLIKGRLRKDMMVLGQQFIRNLSVNKFYKPAIRILHQMKKEGAWVGIFSSSPEFLVLPLSKRLGVCGAGTTYGTDEMGRYCAIKDCLTGEKKGEKVFFLKKENGLKKITCLSNSFLDLPFLSAGDEAVAVRPDRLLKQFAKRIGWKVI